MDDAIRHMYYLKSDYQRLTNRNDTTVPGLYIEMKEPQWYMDNYGFDIVQMTYDQLAKWNLETIEKSTANGIPIIIQSFDPEALKRFAALSDLPLVQLMYWNETYNFEDIATYASGVGPDSKYIMYWPST
jgi:glycerophosphoryl diester phosphodiesterase